MNLGKFGEENVEIVFYLWKIMDLMPVLRPHKYLHYTPMSPVLSIGWVMRVRPDHYKAV